MAVLGQSGVGLLFRIKGDSSEAVKALKDTKTATDDLTTSTTGTGSAFASLAAPAAIAAAGVVAITAAAVSAGFALFNLTKEAAAYGSQIKDASDRTGLAARTISGLKYAAEQGGSSFDKITDSVAKFNVLLGQAREGNEKAIETLKKYGITTLENDEALKQAIKTIGELTNADEKAAAAAVLFKDRTGEIIPVIKGMNGDLDASIKRTEELGIMMDDKTAAAAKRLDDTFTDLSLQFKGAAIAIGIELIPTVQRLASHLSQFFQEQNNLIPQLFRSANDTIV